MSAKQNIRSLDQAELTEILAQWGEKAFRAKQIFEWIWKKSSTRWEDMSNLSADLRSKLDEHFVFHTLKPDDVQHSTDGTIKTAFKLHDNYVVEGVLIPAKDRMTACISSQVGCSLSCAFCATGKLKRMRNLHPDEIYDQVVTIMRQAENSYNKRLSNIVFMGMGEPLLNYKNTLAGIDKICSDTGLGMSPKRITVSTAGLAKQIKQLADDGVRFNLALSLHAANDEKRSQIMPINDSNSLDALHESLRYFYDKTKSRVTFEYIIFKGFNDELSDAEELAAFCKTLPCKINIIEYNSIDDGAFKQADRKKVDAFAALLESRRLIVNIRRSRGKDIDAACGQLANKNKLANAF